MHADRHDLRCRSCGYGIVVAGPHRRRVIDPDLQRIMAERAGSTVVEFHDASQGCVQAMLCGPPSTLTSLRLPISPGSRFADEVNKALLDFLAE